MIGDSRKRYDWSAIQSVYDSGKSTRELASIFGITLGALHSARKRGDLVTRSHADSVRLLLKQGKVDRFSQWTPERRKQQSDRKKKLFSEHPEKHPNRILANNRVNMSYPERLVFDWLKSQNIDFEHNRRIDRYYVDFCVGNNAICSSDQP